jgi:hypothetical protein
MKTVIFHDKIEYHPILAAKVAQKFGHDVIFLGTKLPQEYEINSISLEELNCEDEINYFKSIYKHTSTNPYDYELTCFLRWIYFKKLREKINSNLMVIDSDILLFSKMSDIEKIFDDKIEFLDCPSFNFITDSNNLTHYIDFICEIFKNEKLLEFYAKKYPHNDSFVVSDMTLLFEFAKKFPEYSNIFHGKSLSQYGICTGLHHFTNYENDGFYRTIYHNNTDFFSKKENGEYQKMLALHFQGTQKILMPKFSSLHIDINIKIENYYINEIIKTKINKLPASQSINRLINLYKTKSYISM